jgi:hypothetical protein
LFQVLYHVAHNRLSGKVQTAIKSLDNITRVYHAFVNGRPVTSAISSSLSVSGYAAQRYDQQLVPSAELSRVQDPIRVHFGGVSENMAGLINPLLTLESGLKTVFQKTSSTSSGGASSSPGGATSNETEFQMSRKTSIRHIQHVRTSAALFQVRQMTSYITRCVAFAYL